MYLRGLDGVSIEHITRNVPLLTLFGPIQLKLKELSKNA